MNKVEICGYGSLFGACLLMTGCSKKGHEEKGVPEVAEQPEEVAVFPMSDPENSGGWVLNPDVSDEFNAPALDHSKWFVQGTNGGFHKWKGRAPSQFAPHNVSVSDGMLKLSSQWEPTYDFSKEKFDGRNYENITTAGVISREKFLYGYMEICSKAADAAMTSSFWTLGYQSELDMYEQMGRPSLPQKKGFEQAYMFSIHDWRPGVVAGKNKVFTKTHQLGYRVADDFHVYACEWGEDYLKFFEDGNLVHETSQKELGDVWILTNPLELWFDSETFPWMGLPEEKDLPVDFEIDYVRVWQKPNPNLVDRAFYGFEGPIVLDEVQLPDSDQQSQKFWYIGKESENNFAVSGEKFATGRKSLKFTHDGNLTEESVSAMAPNGSVMIPAGTYTLSMKLWMEPGSMVTKLHPILDAPWLQITPIDLTKVSKGEWVEVSQTFSRAEDSGQPDRLRFTIQTWPSDGSRIAVERVDYPPDALARNDRSRPPRSWR